MTETVFKQVNYDLGSIIKFIELGEIGLPDIQRTFVWKNSKVRDLFDSMYQGYPVGYLLFWQNAFDEDARFVGTDNKQKPSRLLIVDGQQRLTSLYAVVKGVQVIKEGHAKENIEIAFNPLREKFTVADAAVRRNRAFIPNISKVWSDNQSLITMSREYIEGLQSVRHLEEEEKGVIEKSLSKLHSLMSFPLTALELVSGINEEQVADVFVRINSKGTPLNQADFILTLMSVFWDEGRRALERFCEESRIQNTGRAGPYNHFIQPDPDQLLRVSIGLGFKRGRLRSVYSILRGKDLESDSFNPKKRESQFAILKQSQTRVLDLQNWHDFLKCILAAGFRSYKLISSQNNLLFAYTLYLLGRTEFSVDEFKLRSVIARWFYMSAITGRFTGSQESQIEFDLARFRNVNNPDDFIKILMDVCESTITQDFWSITLPNELATASPRSPSMFGYFAALNLLEATALFSDSKISELLDPSTTAPRSALERHHLFPKNHLKTLGITELRETNQIANYAIVEWGDNAKIRDLSPSNYVPTLKERFNSKKLERMYYWHALPDNWEEMEYTEFLKQRRELMAKVMKDAYQGLLGNEECLKEAKDEVTDLVSRGEDNTTEFKSTLRVNLHTREKDHRIEFSVLKTIAAFINTSGGKLVIGVADNGELVGIETDQFKNEDKMYLHLVNLINHNIGSEFMIYIHPSFDDYEEGKVMVVECTPGKSPVFLKDDSQERFYIRTGASATELKGGQMQNYINKKFG